MKLLLRLIFFPCWATRIVGRRRPILRSNRSRAGISSSHPSLSPTPPACARRSKLEAANTFGKAVEDHRNGNSGLRCADFAAADKWAAAKVLLPRRHMLDRKSAGQG